MGDSQVADSSGVVVARQVSQVVVVIELVLLDRWWLPLSCVVQVFRGFGREEREGREGSEEERKGRMVDLCGC